MPNLDSLTATLKISLSATPQKNSTGADYQPLTTPVSISKTETVGTSNANGAVGGCDELISKVYSINASSSITIDLTSLTDILLQTGVSLARVKGIMIRLLSATDDTVIPGTAAAYITVGNNGANDFVSQSGTGWLNGASSAFDIPNGGALAFLCPNAGGVIVDGTHKIIKIANGDGALVAKAQVSILGGTT